MTGPKSIRSLERGLYVLQALQEQPISSLHDVYRFTESPSQPCCASCTLLSRRGLSRGAWLTDNIVSAPINPI